MSSVYVKLSFDTKNHPLKKLLEVSHSTKRWLVLLDYLSKETAHSNIKDSLKSLNVTFEQASTEYRADFEFGSEIQLSNIEALAKALEKVGLSVYRLALFDSSSGGKQLWVKPEELIEICDAKIYLLGEMDDEEIETTLEDQGALVVETMEACTLIVVGESVSSVDMHQAQKSSIPMLTEEDVWDYFE